MELKLQSDEDAKKQWDTDSYGTAYSNDAGNDPDDDYDDDYDDDDYNDLEEDTVYVADRYKNNSIHVSEPVEIKKNSMGTGLLSYLFFALHILLLFGGFIMMVVAVRTANVGMLSTGKMLTIFGEVMAIVDAILMKVNGGSVSLIVLSIVFVPAYWFKRCKDAGNSSSIAWILVLAFIILVGFYVKNTMSMVRDIYEGAYSSSSDDEETVHLSPEGALDSLEIVKYSWDDKQYYLSKLLTDNIQSMKCVYVPADDTTYTPAYIKFSGKTELYGSSESIEVQVYAETFLFRKIKIGKKTYKEEEYEDVLHDMMAHSTPFQQVELSY